MKTILLVDDEKHMLRLLEYSLSKVGCAILTASSGAAALELLRAQHIDLLLIDFLMPLMNGVETIQEIRKIPSYTQLPIILLTARGQSTIYDQGHALGVSLFLTKPFSPRELSQHVQTLLAGTTP